MEVRRPINHFLKKHWDLKKKSFHLRKNEYIISGLIKDWYNVVQNTCRFMYNATGISLKRWCNNWIQMLMMLNCLWHTVTQTKKIRIQGRNLNLANTHMTYYLQPIKSYFVHDFCLYMHTIIPFKQQCLQYRPMGKGLCNNNFKMCSS